MELNNPRELFQAAEKLIKEKKYLEAINFFERVLTLEKNNTGALGNLSSLFYTLGDYHNAEFYVDQLIRINSNNWQALITKAQICDSLGKDNLSVEYYKKIINIKNDIVEPYSLYVLALFRLKDYSKAKEICEISKNKFKKIMPYLLSGICNTKLNNIDSAESDFKKCIEISANDELTLRSKSVAYLNLRRFKEAFKISFTQNLPDEEQFENFSNYNNAIKKLNQLEKPIILKKTKGEFNKVIYTAADSIYAEKYFENLSRSINNFSVDVMIHLHLMVKDYKSIERFDKIENENVFITYEIFKPKDVSEYTTRRFIRLIQFINYANIPVLALDIDSIIIGKIQDFFLNYKDCDVGIYIRSEETAINKIIHAGMIYFSPTKAALKFLCYFANFVESAENKNGSFWYIDQMALLATEVWCKNNPSIVKVKPITENMLSWNKQTKDTLVITYKGAQKNKYV